MRYQPFSLFSWWGHGKKEKQKEMRCKEDRKEGKDVRRGKRMQVKVKRKEPKLKLAEEEETLKRLKVEDGSRARRCIITPQTQICHDPLYSGGAEVRSWWCFHACVSSTVGGRGGGSFLWSVLVLIVRVYLWRRSYETAAALTALL